MNNEIIVLLSGKDNTFSGDTAIYVATGDVVSQTVDLLILMIGQSALVTTTAVH